MNQVWTSAKESLRPFAAVAGPHDGILGGLRHPLGEVMSLLVV
ncbi:hypothetical protein [Streptomyces sp. NPDC005283]